MPRHAMVEPLRPPAQAARYILVFVEILWSHCSNSSASGGSSSALEAPGADAPGGGGTDERVADAPGGGAADAPVADALEAAAVGADACSPSLKGDKGGKRADRQPEQERQPEKAS